MVRRVLVFIALWSIAVWVACSGGSGGTTSKSSGVGTVNTTVSDPPSCSVSGSTSTSTPNTFSHVYVTITDVQINASSTAGDNDSSWIDLTPALKSAPKQVDLLGLADNQCFLATLGASTQLQAGSYQQIRIILAANNTQVSGNNCGTAGANCVVPAGAGASPQPLLLSSEATTGIKIPSGQIAGGSFTIASGETKDLNIDFNTCASIVLQGNGSYRLKPVLHAGEVSLTSSSIAGKVVDKSSGQAINGKLIVALEQKDANGIDRVIMQTTPDATGAFVFCPVPAGTYDVVAVVVGADASNNAYAATVATGVQPGNALGNVQMIAVSNVSTGTGGTTVTTSTAPATLAGTVSSANGSSAGTAIDSQLSALEQVSGSSTLTFTIPVSATSATMAVTTAKPSTCTSTTCPAYTADFSFTLPPVNPTMGAWASAGTSYNAGAAGSATYQVEAQAFVPQSGGTADCNPSTITTAATTVQAGATTNAPAISFTGCQ